MTSRETDDQSLNWKLRLALYRLWRVRRGILLFVFLPILAFYGGTFFHPVWGPHFFPDFSLSHPFPTVPEVAFYGMTFDGALFFVLGCFLVAAFIAVMWPNIMGFASTLWIVVSLIIALMPWLWASVAPALEKVPGLGLTLALVCFGAIRLAKVFWQRQWHSGISFPGTITTGTQVTIARPPEEILAALQNAPGSCHWNEMVGKVQDSPDTPGRRIVLHVTGGGYVQDVVDTPSESELVLECQTPDRPEYVEVVGARVSPDESGTRLEVVSQSQGYPLLYAFSHWVEDGAADQFVYFRDRLEGRPSLTNRATFVRFWNRNFANLASEDG